MTLSINYFCEECERKEMHIVDGAIGTCSICATSLNVPVESMNLDTEVVEKPANWTPKNKEASND